MSPEKTKELINIYPELFSDLHHMNCFSLFGFECGDGWFDLLKDLITGIKEICESPQFNLPLNIDDQPLEIKVDQVKEKYGTLRFYYNSCNAFIDKLINEAEDASETICEDCGKPGTLRDKNHWYSVRCDECWPKPSKWT